MASSGIESYAQVRSVVESRGDTSLGLLWLGLAVADYFRDRLLFIHGKLQPI